MKDWDELTIEESVHHLRKRYGVDSSGDAKCIFKLIEFYNDMKKNQCGQCGRWFDNKEEVNSHSHVNDIAEQMREDERIRKT
jgi:hypothetical protein